MRKETLLNGKQRVMKVSVISSIGLAMLLGSATVSLAQQDNTGSSSKCTCQCYSDKGSGTGGGFLQEGTYDSKGLPCGAFENKTCNVEASPGIIRTGKLIGCSTASTSGAARSITILPPRSATLATTGSKTITPKVPVTGTTTQRK